MEEWVALCPILEVCNRDTGYEGVWRLRETWWEQTVARKQLSATLKYILAAARERRWKSGRRGRGGGDNDAEESEDVTESDGSRDAGMETGDAQVEKLSCVDAQQNYTGY